MKQISLVLIVAFIVISCKSKDPEPSKSSTPADYNPGTGWNLSWSEEFEGTSLNTSLWNYDLGVGTYGWGNNELQYYRSENIQVADGNLIITAKRENYNSSYFTSGRINTKNKYSFKYGKIVGKIKLPEGYGMWPAFWMLGSTAQVWPSCGEIDIMEMKGGVDKATISTCHWLDNNSVHQYYGNEYSYSANLSQGYHYYEVEWNANTITARFDGTKYNELNITSAEVSELKDNNFFIILNLAVGGNFFSPAITNQSSVTAAFPQTMSVDWIRIYQN